MANKSLKKSSSFKNVTVIINPNAGKMRSKNALYDIVAAFCKENCNVLTKITQASKNAIDIAYNACINQTDLIVCCGGDGTLNEVIEGVLKSNINVPIGYVPAGSTNDFASSMELSFDTKVATKMIINGNNNPIDIGNFNDTRYFTYIASFGAFTAASYNAPQTTKNVLGHFAYVLEGMKEIGNILPYHVKCSTNDKVYEDDYIFGAVCNSTSIGGIVKFDNTIVNMNDGLFEVVLVKNPKNPIELQRIIMGITYSDFSDSMFEFIKTEKICFKMNELIPWSIDGEYDEGSKKIEISNIPSAVLIRK